LESSKRDNGLHKLEGDVSRSLDSKGTRGEISLAKYAGEREGCGKKKDQNSRTSAKVGP